MDSIVYEDVEDVSLTKRNESFWDRQECERQERLSPPVANSEHFVPAYVDHKKVVGLSFPNALDYKKMLHNRECMQFIQQWRCALIRCITKTQWKIVVERYINRVKDCPPFAPALKVVLEDRDLLEIQKSLPDEREKEDRRKCREGDMERDKINWIMDISHEFATKPEQPDETLQKGKVIISHHNKLRENKRQWMTLQSFSYLKNTFPALSFHSEHGTCVVHQVSQKVIQISYDSQTFYIEENQGHGLLSACISPNGRLLAIGNEMCIFVIDTKDAAIFRRLHLDQDMLITAMDLTDTQLVYGTVHGHVHRIDLQKNQGISKVLIPDKVTITQVLRRGSKTIVQSMGAVVLVDGGFQGQDSMIQINVWRPMCLATHGSKVLVLTRSGALFMFSTVVREMFTEIPPPKDFSITVDIGMPWYRGLCFANNAQKLLALFPNGQLREISLKVYSS